MENLYGRSVIPPEQIIGKLREVDVLVGREATAVEACRHIGGVSALPRASDCGPIDAGQLPMARSLGHACMLTLGLLTHFVKHTKFSIGVSLLG